MREREKDEVVIADHNPNGHIGQTGFTFLFVPGQFFPLPNQTSCTFLFVSGHQLEGGEVAEEGNRLPGRPHYCHRNYCHPHYCHRNYHHCYHYAHC